ncbi:MAG: hypothetical protein M3220_09890 [Chloroflexota bacterium]|nr:hypothetical protein [Chloroflexota bacterium]
MKKEQRLQALENQIARLNRRLVRLNALSDRYSWLRLMLFVVGAGVSVMLFFWQGAFFFLLGFLPFALLFGVVVARHRRVEQSIVRHGIWRRLKVAQVARMRLDWAAVPETALHPRAEHPFEADFDLVGERSLHRLIDTTVSLEGSERLRAWLTDPVPDRDALDRRQAVVRELIPLAPFRDRLRLEAQLATGEMEKWRARELLDWFESHAPDPSRWAWLLLASGLAALNLLLFALDLFGVLPPLWIITGLLYGGVFVMNLSHFSHLFDEALELREVVEPLRAVFEQLERYPYRNTPHLRALCAPFLDPDHRPSEYMKRIARVVNATGVRGNPLVHLLLNVLAPWDFYFAYRLEVSRAAVAERLPAWLDVWFDLEVLGALANLAYLNPHYTLPIVRADAASPYFQGEELGHPLIPDEQKVHNDFSSCGPSEITIITGSNMAGKSSFLKTVGMNLALAYAGGPVDAQRLETTPMRLFACIRVSDSVTDGISYFYAEVQSLKKLLAALKHEHLLPLFFFIDEIFRGTNNRERLIGSRAYIRSLAGERGLGLLSTHDLELVQLAEEMPQVRNYHFREEVIDGRMVFDYTLRPGPCPTTNALIIMEMEGLPVEATEVA